MHLPSPNCPDVDQRRGGGRRYVQAARLKASRPSSSGCLNTPTPTRRVGVVFFLDFCSSGPRWGRFFSKGVPMPLINYDKPMPFPYTVEATAILLQHSLVTLGKSIIPPRQKANPLPLFNIKSQARSSTKPTSIGLRGWVGFEGKRRFLRLLMGLLSWSVNHQRTHAHQYADTRQRYHQSIRGGWLDLDCDPWQPSAILSSD